MEEDDLIEIANDLGYLTEPQLLALAGITAGTAQRWRALHKGPQHVVFGNRFLYSKQAVKAWLDQSSSVREEQASTTQHGGKRQSKAHLL